jgi:hypothetical protein
MLRTAQGDERWKKAVKLKGEIRGVKPLDNAIAGAEEIDVEDNSTGEGLLGGAVKEGGALAAMDGQALFRPAGIGAPAVCRLCACRLESCA